MSNQTVSSSTNFDTGPTSLGNGESITIDTGAVLTINSDVRWGQNAAVIGDITISSTSGGTCLIDGTATWWIPFDGGTSTIPAVGSTVTGATSTATGELLGVWTALGVAPSAAGGATPATGFVKLRSKSGTFQDNENLQVGATTFAVVNSSTGGQRGWIHIVGATTKTITVPRLGLFQCSGDWFEIGTTSGNNDDSWQYYVADFCPVIWVETGNGTGVYEPWCEIQSRWNTATKYISTDARGKFFNCTSAGVISIAKSGANACGFVPPAGCKVRVPNIHISGSSSADWTANLAPPATITDRWETATTTAGRIIMDKVNTTYFYLNSDSAYQCDVSYCGFYSGVSITKTSTEMAWNNVVVTPYTTVDRIALSIQFSKIIMTGGRFIRYDSSDSASANTLDGIYSSSFSSSQFEIFGDATAVTRGNASASSLILQRSTSVSFTGCSFIGGRWNITSSSLITATDSTYADCHIGTTTTTNPTNGIYFEIMCMNCTVDGFGNFASIANVHPYNGLVFISQCNAVDVRGIGTAVAKYDCGSSNASAYVVRSGGGLANCRFQQLYCSNIRTAAVLTLNSDLNTMVESVWGDTSLTQAITCGLGTIRGCQWLNSTSGQSAVYGTHWSDAFTSTTAGRLVIHCNEPTTASAAQCAITAGTPKFDGAGSCLFPATSDAVTWTMPYFALGYTSFTNGAPTLTGTQTGKVTLEYDIDTGTGWRGNWTALTGANLSGETITATTGFKLKVRGTANATDATTKLTYIRIDLTTDATSQQEQYPLDVCTVTVTGLATGSRVKLYKVSDGTVLGTAAESSGSVSFETTYVGMVYVEARCASGSPYYKPWLTQLTTVSGETVTAFALQVRDDQ